ncbi:MAG: S8 family peptidase [Ignavibacteria bacterium]|nr:S8 family peptidase [Ignavibacteria bacterium]
MNNTKILISAFLLLSLSFFGFNDVYTPKYKMMNDIVIKRSDGALYQKGKVNIKFKSDIYNFTAASFGVSKLDNLLSSYGVNKIEQLFPLKQDPSKRMTGDDVLAKMFQINYSSDTDPTDLSAIIFEQNKDILDYAEPEFVYVSDFTPNDPYIGSQYHINFRISAYNAWNVTQGDTSVVIGIVDSGSDLDHPDLAANIKYNYLEIPNNSIDDDANGYVDDWRGWDFAGADYQNLSQDNDPNIYGSNCEHGSHVSGCASEVTNNGIGGAGIGFKCKLLISKHGADNDYTGSGYSYIYNSNNGIVYCYQNGAKVINCSFGGSSYSSQTQLVITYAWLAGTVVCASAGNEGQNVPRYPASYQYAVSVASTTSSDLKSWFSNYHSTVDVCAPGSGIYSTLWNNGYASFDGTSMSAPIAAGTVALIWAKYPSYTPDQIVNRLVTGVDSIYNLNPSYVGLLGSGRINAYKSVMPLTSVTPNGNAMPENYSLSQNYPNPFNPVTKINFSVPKSSNVVLKVFDATGREIETLVKEQKTAGSYTVTFDAKAYSSGAYYYKISAGDFSQVKKMLLIK